MANNTANILEVEHGDLEAIQEAMRDGNYEDTGTPIWFNFNKVCPMPEALNDTKSPPTIFPTQEEVDEWNEKYNAPGDYCGCGRALTQDESDQLIAEHGTDNWYNWQVVHWGTKNGAHSYREEGWTGDSLYFETAWSPPEKIIECLSKKFPEATFTLKYADEGGGFLGYTEFIGGESSGASYLDWDSEAGIALREELGRYWPEEEEEEDECAHCGCEFEVDPENDAHTEGYCSEKCMKASDEATPGEPEEVPPDFWDFEYSNQEECIKSGGHLTKCDNDGYCNFCGYQDE